jgi:cellulose synthase/poly-beta-1,6-N-acetylglucosamine synthase-like glycosyltransferase
VTDADCTASQQWLRSIALFYSSQPTAFIAAPVVFRNDKSLLQIFQALDFLVLQGITAASVGARFHSMCNGANLAYTKEAFQAVRGFEGIDQVATGDDLLLMHKIRKSYPQQVHYLKSKEAIISTAPMPGLKEFLMQRKRWASKTFVYDDYRIIAVLGFVFLFNLLFFVLIGNAFIHPATWWYPFLFLIAKTLIEWPFTYSVARFYEKESCSVVSLVSTASSFLYRICWCMESVRTIRMEGPENKIKFIFLA